VTIILSNVPPAVYNERNPSLPFILHGLLQHEHKQSVLHFVVQRNTEYDAPVKAKVCTLFSLEFWSWTDRQDPLVLCVGARRYVVNPVYSQHVRGGGKGVNNVHKSEKFLRAGSAVVATCFGPITFGKSGVVLLKDEGAEQGT
jgi:pre-rRNA-processing protein TSR1